jgi:hypothetical protein
MIKSSKKKVAIDIKIPKKMIGADNRYILIEELLMAVNSLCFARFPIVKTEASKTDIGIAISIYQGN